MCCCYLLRFLMLLFLIWCYLFSFWWINISKPKMFKCIINITDCSLRQGAGGTENTRNWSRTCFLRWFYNRSQAYFGEKSEEHIKTSKKRCMDVKNDDLRKTCVTFVDGKTVFFRFLAEIRLRMLIKSPQKTSSQPICRAWQA